MNKLKSIFALIVLMLFYTACGSGTNTYDSSPDVKEYHEPPSDYGMQSEDNNDSRSIATSESDLPENGKFIVRTTLYVETEDFDKSVKVIETMTSDLKGYIESVDASYGSTYDRTKIRFVHYMLRIPKGSTAKAVNTVKSEVGVVVREEMNTENVTKRIRDLERDIDLLKAKEDRLIELSKKTEDIDAMIRIESELASTISTREFNQAQLQNIEHDVQFDYLSVELQEVRQVSVLEQDSFAGDVKTAFRDSIDGMIDFFQDLVLFFVRGWFGILILIFFIIILVKIFKKLGKKPIVSENECQSTGNGSSEKGSKKTEVSSKYKDENMK